MTVPTKVLIWDPCRVGLPEMLTLAYMTLWPYLNHDAASRPSRLCPTCSLKNRHLAYLRGFRAGHGSRTLGP